MRWDYILNDSGKPGFKIEIGSPKYIEDFTQLPYSEYEKIWFSNRDIPEYLLRFAASELDDANEQGEESKHDVETEQIQDGRNGHGLYPSE